MKSKETVDKIANSIVFFTKELGELNKTQILKLLFFVEEYSVSKYNSPFYNIPFQAWKFGPVIKDVFIELSDDLDLFKNYLSKNNDKFNSKVNFNDDEFSDNDIEILKAICKKYDKKTASELVKETHKENSLWQNAVRKGNLKSSFDSGIANNSDVEIDFTEHLSGCQKEKYNTILEARQSMSQYI